MPTAAAKSTRRRRHALTATRSTQWSFKYAITSRHPGDLLITICPVLTIRNLLPEVALYKIQDEFRTYAEGALEPGKLACIHDITSSLSGSHPEISFRTPPYGWTQESIPVIPLSNDTKELIKCVEMGPFMLHVLQNANGLACFAPVWLRNLTSTALHYFCEGAKEGFITHPSAAAFAEAQTEQETQTEQTENKQSKPGYNSVSMPTNVHDTILVEAPQSATLAWVFHHCCDKLQIDNYVFQGDDQVELPATSLLTEISSMHQLSIIHRFQCTKTNTNTNTKQKQSHLIQSFSSERLLGMVAEA